MENVDNSGRPLSNDITGSSVWFCLVRIVGNFRKMAPKCDIVGLYLGFLETGQTSHKTEVVTYLARHFAYLWPVLKGELSLLTLI